MAYVAVSYLETGWATERFPGEPDVFPANKFNVDEIKFLRNHSCEAERKVFSWVISGFDLTRYTSLLNS